MTKRAAIFLIVLFCLHLKVISQKDTAEISRISKLAWEIRFSNLDTSFVLADKALELLKKVKGGPGLPPDWKTRTKARLFYYQSIFYLFRGDNLKAIDLSTDALKLATEIKDEHAIAQAYSGLGLAYTNMGNLSDALEYTLKSLKIHEKRNYKEGIAVQYSNLGNIYESQKNHVKGLDYYQKALKIALELNNNKIRVAIQYGNIGNVYFLMNDTKKGLEFYEKSLKIHEELNNKVGISMMENNIGNIYQQTGNYPKSLEHYQIAKKTAEEAGGMEHILSPIGNIGVLYSRMKDYKKGEENLVRAIQIAEQMKATDAIYEFEGALSDLYNNTGNYKKALDHYKKCVAAKDSIFNVSTAEKNTRLEMNYEFEKKQAFEKAQHEKAIIAMEADNKLQKQLRIFLLIFIALILVSLYFMKRAYDNKKRVAGFLAAESHRKEVLLQEVHHRINNNLQIISSLLTLQANSVNDPKLSEYLQQSQNRIQSLSSLHELLYQNDSPLNINMKDYLDKVLDFHRDVLRTKSLDAKINTDINPVSLPMKVAVPIALIVNELVTNSIKYAFTPDSKGYINVVLKPGDTDNTWKLTISDSGPGLPAETGMRKDSLGLRLVNIMTKQMEASLTKTNSPGANFTLSFSVI